MNRRKNTVAELPEQETGVIDHEAVPVSASRKSGYCC